MSKYTTDHEGNRVEIHNSGHSADDVGLGVRQTQSRAEPDLEARHRFARGMSQTPLESDRYGDVQAREMEEDLVVKEAHRKIKEILEEDDEPVQRQVQQRPVQQPQRQSGLSLADLAEGLEGQLDMATSDVARDLLVENFHGGGEAPSEAALYTNAYAAEPQQRPVSHDWTTKKYSATLRGGKQIPVWKVFNKESKMSMETPFRIQEAAERIATILNQSGDVNDRRIKSVMEAYNIHRKLMKHIRQLREAIKAGNTKLKPKLVEAQDRLEQVNIKLGI